MVTRQDSKLWQPERFTHGVSARESGPQVKTNGIIPYLTIILNNPLENRQLLIDICNDGTMSFSQQQYHMFQLTADLAIFTICADGGANRLRDLLQVSTGKVWSITSIQSSTTTDTPF